MNWKSYLCLTMIIVLFTPCTSISIQYQIDIDYLQENNKGSFKNILNLLDNDHRNFSDLIILESKIDKIIAAEPHFLPAYVEKARLTLKIGLEGDGDFRIINQNALEILNDIIPKAPNYPKPYILAGRIYINLKQYEKAWATLKKADELKSNDPWLHNNWAALLGVKKKYKEAFNRSKKALRNSKNNRNALVVAINNIVEFSSKTETKPIDYRSEIADTIFNSYNDPLERLEVAKEIVDSYDGRQQLFYIVYEILKRQKGLTPELENIDLELAYLIFKSGFRVAKGNVKYYNTKTCEKAKMILTSLKEKESFKNRIFEMEFDIAMSNKNLSQAGFLLGKAKEEKITGWLFEERQGLYFYETRKYQALINRFEHLAKSDPMYGNNALLMSAYYKTGNVKKLGDFYKMEAERYKTNAWAQGNYATFLLFYLNDPDGAIQYGRKALKLMDYPIAREVTSLALLTKAGLLFSEGKVSPSEKLYNEALLVGFNNEYVKKNCRKHCRDIDSMIAFHEANK